VNDSMNQQAWLFTFAEQSLIEFAERVEQDIPDSCMFARMLKHVELESNYLGHNSNEGSILSEQEELSTKILWSNKTKSNTDPAYSLSTFDELLLGTFKQRVLSAFFSEN
ncbi:diguanylate cyclase, partial [Vibrio sp. 10N.222.55.F12]